MAPTLPAFPGGEAKELGQGGISVLPGVGQLLRAACSHGLFQGPAAWALVDSANVPSQIAVNKTLCNGGTAGPAFLF